MSFRLGAALAAGFFACAAPSALAATDTDGMTVTATVIASCDVVADDLAFGNYDPVSGTPLDAETEIDVTCTNGTDYTISLNQGVGTGATVAARLMTSGADTLTYALYQDSNHTIVWGQTIGVDTVAATGSGVAQTYDVYGRVPIHQTAPAGAGYTDTITVTVTYN
ncbi:MAG: spore coat U domain-containing protein [Hyphomonadaceae bacterium]